ncbi:MAG: ammonia-forming cytochrome c nitrite reductase subunit c552 [Verrucomicrobia bacterium]|nr:MAG: ammonia-forming cytochrome c nitrite reductase subunit c552 [Verrucomicrobiota bacterium]
MNTTETPAAPQFPKWVGPVIFGLTAGIIVVLALLAISIMERRWEAQRPALVLKPIAQWEPNNAVWGQNYPREYESYLRTRETGTRSKFGGGPPRNYLNADPLQVILFAGYPFSKEYNQARGHYYSVTDVSSTKRVNAKTPGTCWTCKSTDVPKKMAELGVDNFYKQHFADLKSAITHPIGCQDCHDPATMNLRITRPALREAFAAQGRKIGDATHQEMRSLVCAQCHVEYYFRDKYYLAFPWDQGKGLTVEDFIAYYDERDFTDYVHAVSKAPMLKAQHPDFELYSQGVHAYRGVSCADCHMPYRSEGGVKFTDHHVQSPLLNIANSCAVCHRWSEDEIRHRVETIQTKVLATKAEAERALVQAHFDIAAAAQAGVADADLAAARKLIRHAQFRWDFISAANGAGFHAPQEATRILADAINEAQQVRLDIARRLAAKGISATPKYPDVSTREKADAVMKAFEASQKVELL